MSNKLVYADNGNVKMETRDHLKNGASLKSQMSRKSFFNFLIIAVIVVSAVFTACSSPEKDGKKAAKMICECKRKFPNEEEFFHSGGWVRPSEKLEQCLTKATEKGQKLMKKYATNKQKVTDFNFAADETAKQCGIH